MRAAIAALRRGVLYWETFNSRPHTPSSVHMPLDWSPLADLIRRHERFLVVTHVRPDGDALGSALAMAGLLRGLGRSARVVITSPMPPRYAFLDREGEIVRFGEPGAQPADLADVEVLVILDLSSWGQLGDLRNWVEEFRGPRLVIDHHVSGDDLGAVVIKDTSAESTGTLVLDAAIGLHATISPQMAEALFTAIAMDTGWFRHSCTRPSTFEDAARLQRAGADPHAIFRALFERNTQARLNLLGRAVSGLRRELEGRVAYATITREDFYETGAIPPETEDLVDYTVSLEGVEVGLLFIEQLRTPGVKLSIRTRTDFDCTRLAERFGGGGHRAAAGANLDDPLPERIPEVLSVLGELLESRPEQHTPHATHQSAR